MPAISSWYTAPTTTCGHSRGGGVQGMKERLLLIGSQRFGCKTWWIVGEKAQTPKVRPRRGARPPSSARATPAGPSPPTPGAGAAARRLRKPPEGGQMDKPGGGQAEVR